VAQDHRQDIETKQHRVDCLELCDRAGLVKHFLIKVIVVCDGLVSEGNGVLERREHEPVAIGQ
jgi:hypothetical protein